MRETKIKVLNKTSNEYKLIKKYYVVIKNQQINSTNT